MSDPKTSGRDTDLAAANPSPRPRIRLIPRDEQSREEQPSKERRNRYTMMINGEAGWENIKPETKVGYGNPPEHTRFQPGISGNPFGRPKGSRNLRTALEKIFTDKVSVRVEGRPTKVTRLEAVFMQQMKKALQGDNKAMQVISNTAQAFGLMKERPQRLVFGNLHALTQEELSTLESLYVKAAGIIEDM